MRVLLSSRYNPRLMLRQTAGGRGAWGSIKFCVDDTALPADLLVVFDEPASPIETRIPKERRILFVTEPDDCKHYPASYLRDYGTVVSPFELRQRRGRQLKRQPGLPWWLGAGDFFDKNATASGTLEDIAEAPVPRKTRTLSVVCSTHSIVPMHRKRIEFVKYIKKYFGDDLHWYGRGVRTMEDKAEAILPYRYHITLENNQIDHFWTEKLADCYLGYAFPIYSGCNNASDYFPRYAFEPININNPEAAITTIKAILSRDPWEERLPLIKEARERVWHEYNFFNSCAEIIGELEAVLPPLSYLHRPEILRPIPTPFRQKLKVWERRYRRGFRAVLERQGLIRPRRSKWKDIIETAVPIEEAGGS